MAVSDHFSEEDRKKILRAIAEAENQTSGEIRLFVENKCDDSVLDRAAFVFGQLEMQKTKDRNGVLFYVAFDSRQFAILGDAGIHAKVKDDFWNDIKNRMAEHFKKGEFVEGLSEGIRQSGEALRKHFPHQRNDRNELPDDIIFNNNSNL
ncbi:MAG: TPM domain-containing protein [Bacteroidia bacterium]